MNALLALAILTSQEPVEQLSPEVVNAIRYEAIRLEILDPREAKYTLVKNEDFQSDLGMIRGRYQKLKDAPPVADYSRFPPRQVLSDFLTFNRAFRSYLEARSCVDFRRAALLYDAIVETDRLYRIYDLARDANSEYYYCTVRKEALANLRELLGTNYYTATLPPPVPTHLFSPVE